jgi:hypothetical protein
LIGHALSAPKYSQEAQSAIDRAIAGAAIFKCVRGEVDDVVNLLLGSEMHAGRKSTAQSTWVMSLHK